MLETSEDEYPTRTIIIAAGIGAFEARKLGVEGEDRFEEKGLFFKVLDPRRGRGVYRGEQRRALDQPQGQGEPGAVVQHGAIRAEG